MGISIAPGKASKQVSSFPDAVMNDDVLSPAQ